VVTALGGQQGRAVTYHMLPLDMCSSSTISLSSNNALAVTICFIIIAPCVFVLAGGAREMLGECEECSSSRGALG